jgi:hypothetical protein
VGVASLRQAMTGRDHAHNSLSRLDQNGLATARRLEP